MKIKRLFPIIISFIALLVIGFFYENKVSYIHFVDEEENIVTANYMLAGERFYSDIFSQHQPVASVISMGIQKTTNPTSIFLLIKRHREFIIAWSIIWATFIIARFGLWTLPAVLTYEASKIFLLGNLFLAESLSVYPLVYLSALVITKTNIKKIECLFVGICLGFLFFLLLPLWPVLGVIAFMLANNNRKKLLIKTPYLLVGFLGVFALLSKFTSWTGWLEAVAFNYKYYLPINAEQTSFATIIKSFSAFLISLFPGVEVTPILIITRVVSLLFILTLIYSFTHKLWKEALTLLMLLGLANIRYIPPGLDYYRGFHLNPWFGILVTFTFWLIFVISKKNKCKGFFAVISLLTILLVCSISKNALFVKRDVMSDYYIYFSKFVDAGGVINAIKKPDDSLFVVPDAIIVYWQGNIKHFSKYIFFYPFMEKVPIVVDDIQNLLNNKKPTFFYCQCQDSQIMRDYLTNYTPILKNGKQTDLYIISNRANLETSAQEKYFDYFNYSF